MTATRGRAPRTSALAALLLAILVAVAAAAWVAASLTGDSAGPESDVTLRELVEEPERYAGDRLTVSGDVAATHRRPPALAIGDDAGQPAVVLLPPDRPVAAWPDPDDVARVTGTVRIFHFAEYASGLDETDLAGDDPFFGDFEGEAAIVADRIDILEEGTTSPMLGDQASE